MQISGGFIVSDADFGIDSMESHPSGAFAITLNSGYAVIGVKTNTQLRVARNVMSAVGPNDAGVFSDIGTFRESGSQRGIPKNPGMVIAHQYDTSCVNAKQAIFLNKYISELKDPITRLQDRSRQLYEEIIGKIELEPVTSRHIGKTLLLAKSALGEYFSDLLNPTESTGIGTASLKLRHMIKRGNLFKATPIGMRVVHMKKLEYRDPKNAPESGSNLLQISSQKNPLKWNPQRFGDQDAHGSLRGNLDGIILSQSSVDFYNDKNMGFIYYSRGGYYMEISPEHAQSIRISPELAWIVHGKLGNIQRKLPDYMTRIMTEAKLIDY